MNQVEKVAPYGVDKSKKNEVYKMFNQIAPTYDFLNHALSLGIDRRWRKQLVKNVRHSHPGKILDIATGTGDLAFMLQSIHPDEITGLDLSDNMIEYAKKKKKSKVKDDVDIKFVVGDSENLQFESESFDLVTCAFGVRNFENIDKGIEEMYRVLKPGGSIAILEFCESKNKLFRGIFDFYFKNILPFLGKIISKDSHAYYYLPKSVEYFPKGEKFAVILQKMGFEKIKIKTLTNGVVCLYLAQKPKTTK